MASTSPLFPAIARVETPAVRADAHLDTRGHGLLGGVLTPHEAELLHALVVPDGPAPLPEGLEHVELEPVLDAAETAGLIGPLVENAGRAGLTALVDAAQLRWHRQRFIARERWNTARRAAQEIRAAVGASPMALGSLAGAASLFGRPELRLHGTLGFLVDERKVGAARRAVKSLRGVEIVGRVLPGRRRQAAEEALWLRASGTLEWGWRVPSLEDQTLLACGEVHRHTGAQRLGALVDLTILAEEPTLHWETFAQRANVWRARGRAHSALLEARDTLGAYLPASVELRLRPGMIERMTQLFAGV